MSQSKPASTQSARLLLALLGLAAAPVSAHHSYSEFNQNESYTFSGVISAVEWSNPHILLHVTDDERTMLVEWVTTAGADITGVSREQLAPGKRISVTGSRHRNPTINTMTSIKELAMPVQDWRWIPPSRKSAR